MIENKSTSLAIIVPFRNRAEHLAAFVPHINYYLKNKHPEISYQIYVIEQSDNKLFNRAKLLNTGFSEALKERSYDYVCFHDVDMLAEEADYSLPTGPVHLAKYLEVNNYQPVYESYFGGVNLFLTTDFKKINGFSNEYWGWGAEDDDLRLRCEYEGLKILDRDGRFATLPHKAAKQFSPSHVKNRIYLKEMKAGEIDYKKDGLTNLEYEVIEIIQKQTYTLIKVLI